MTNPVSVFVLDTLERASKTAAQVALLAFGSERVDVLHSDWKAVAGLAGGGFLLSLLTSIASQPIGNKEAASLLKTDTAPAPVLVAPATATAASGSASDVLAEAARIFPSS